MKKIDKSESQIELTSINEYEKFEKCYKKNNKRLSNYPVDSGNGKKINFFKIRKKLFIKGIIWSILCFILMTFSLIIGVFIKPSSIFMPISSIFLSLIVTSTTRQIASPLIENIIWLEMYYGGKLSSIDIIVSNSVWSIHSLFIVLKNFRMKNITIVFLTFLIMILLSYLSPIWSLLLRLENTDIENSSDLNYKTCDKITNLTIPLNIKNSFNNRDYIIKGKLIDSFPKTSYGWGIGNLNYSKINVSCIPEKIDTCQFGNSWGIKPINSSCNPNMKATDILIYEKNNKITFSMLKNINYLNYDIYSNPNTFTTSCSLEILTGITEANISSENILYAYSNNNLYLDNNKTNSVVSYISNINDDFFKKYILFGVSILEDNPYNFIENAIINVIHLMTSCENTNNIVNIKYSTQHIDVILQKNAVIMSFICIFILHIYLIILECILLPKLGILRGRSIISTISCIDIELCKILQKGHSAENPYEIRKNINKNLKLYYGYIINSDNNKQLICTNEKVDNIENNKIYY